MNKGHNNKLKNTKLSWKFTLTNNLTYTHTLKKKYSQSKRLNEIGIKSKCKCKTLKFIKLGNTFYTQTITICYPNFKMLYI